MKITKGTAAHVKKFTQDLQLTRGQQPTSNIQHPTWPLEEPKEHKDNNMMEDYEEKIGWQLEKW
jgi:hypothetical protein